MGVGDALKQNGNSVGDALRQIVVTEHWTNVESVEGLGRNVRRKFLRIRTDCVRKVGATRDPSKCANYLSLGL